MQRRESTFATEFSKWQKYNWPADKPAYWEFKVSRTKSLPFSEVSDKQKTNLQLKRLYHKFSDYDRMGTPFDAVSFAGKGYVVIQFWRPRNKEFFIIPVDKWVQEVDNSQSNKKSITEERAREIGQTCFLA
jgi:penicillin-binding protein-related factor A (putative recombinase)